MKAKKKKTLPRRSIAASSNFEGMYNEEGEEQEL